MTGHPIRRGLWLGVAALILGGVIGAGEPLTFDAPACIGDGLREGGPCPVAYQIAGIGCHGDGPGILISIFISEVGFAFSSEDEALPVRLQVERVRGVDPSRVRRLLGENRTLGEIKEEIEGEDGAYSYRGNLRLGRAPYLLDRLNVTLEGGTTTLEADLMVPAGGWGAIPSPGSGPEMVGKLTVEILQQNGSEISVGSLLIFSGPYAGSYAVILDPSIGAGVGMEGCPLAGITSGWGLAPGGPGWDPVAAARSSVGGPSSLLGPRRPDPLDLILLDLGLSPSSPGLFGGPGWGCGPAMVGGGLDRPLPPALGI